MMKKSRIADLITNILLSVATGTTTYYLTRDLEVKELMIFIGTLLVMLGTLLYSKLTDIHNALEEKDDGR
jgi:hypothetical protein